jgi:glycosyltransferase involved in cell wall biosynthesis
VPLTFGIDARAAAEVPAGRGRVVRELLAGLARVPGEHAFDLYCRTPADLPLDERFAWRAIPVPDPLWHLAAAVRASFACDGFLSTNSYLTAWFTLVPTAVIVYDLVPFVEGAQAQQRAQRIERATIGPGVRRARALVCISEATRRDLVARFPRAGGRSSVVHLAADARFGAAIAEPALEAVRERYGLRSPFVMAAGTLEPRKNLVRLIEAFAGLDARERAGHELVLVGPKGWEAEEVLRLAGASGGVRLLGYVPDEDLAALYRLCTVFAYPSLYEGFGLPVLEAMQSGAPVVTTRLSSLPEVAGDAARYIEDPHDVAAIRAALASLLAAPDERERLRVLGLERARAFSWDRAARETLAVLERISASRRAS